MSSTLDPAAARGFATQRKLTPAVGIESIDDIVGDLRQVLDA